MKKYLSDFPELVKEFHPTKNGNLKPADFTYGSSKKIWWKCPKDHNYLALIYNRTVRKSGCRVCANLIRKPWSKKIKVNGILFETISSAGKYFNISRDTLSKYIKEDNEINIELPETYYSDTRFKNNQQHKIGSIEYLRSISLDKGLVNLEDWYGAYREVILPSHFSKFVNKNWSGDWVKFLEDLYPDTEIEFWKLKRIPLSIWKKQTRVNQYLDWLGKRLQFETLSDWYSLTTKDILSNHGDGLYRCYLSIYKILLIRFPNEKVLVWKISKVPSSTWEDKNIHKSYIKFLAQQLGFKEKTDWYSITLNQFNKYGGRTILKQYETLIDCLRTNLPSLNLLPWKFKKSGREFWSKYENRKWFVSWMINEIGIKNKYDYYSISERHFLEYGGITALGYHEDSPAKCIIELFPELYLDFAEFDKTSKGQLNLYRYLKNKFPNTNILYNYKHPTIKFQKSKRKVEIDIFMEQLKIGIEVQGEQHYRSAWGGKKELDKIIARDIEKRKLFKNSKLLIYEIKQIKLPMSWDKIDEFLNIYFPSLMLKLNETKIN